MCQIMVPELTNVLTQQRHCHSSVVSSAPTILRPGFESQAHHLHFFQFVLNCNEKRTKINKKEAGIDPFFLKKLNNDIL